MYKGLLLKYNRAKYDPPATVVSVPRVHLSNGNVLSGSIMCIASIICVVEKYYDKHTRSSWNASAFNIAIFFRTLY